MVVFSFAHPYAGGGTIAFGAALAALCSPALISTRDGAIIFFLAADRE